MNLHSQNEKEVDLKKGAFLKAMIKIANPTWTPQQIEAEVQKKLSQPENSDDPDCIACSG